MQDGSETPKFDALRETLKALIISTITDDDGIYESLDVDSKIAVMDVEGGGAALADDILKSQSFRAKLHAEISVIIDEFLGDVSGMKTEMAEMRAEIAKLKKRLRSR